MIEKHSLFGRKEVNPLKTGRDTEEIEDKILHQS